MRQKPRLLYICGVCLFKNTSANMSHNAFVKGFIENGYEVDIVMPEDSWGEQDSKLKKLDANYHIYKYYSVLDRIRLKYFSRAGSGKAPVETVENSQQETSASTKSDHSLRDSVKRLFYRLSRGDSRYGDETYWLKQAVRFSSDYEYDLVVSNSCPEASHKLGIELIERKRIRCKRWIQIWEDPWYYDVYGGYTDVQREEEHLLLRKANEIFYVSPLTLMYQKHYFNDSADKMRCVPLPYFDFSDSKQTDKTEKGSFGYFGDYYSHTRNLQPFYDALNKSGNKGFIYGDTDLNLKSNERIEVSGRVTLDVLAKVQEKTDILVHLSNLKGGQIPGKIYHYSATDKPILFILDGTEEERKALREYFGQYDRYYFCENTTNSISEAMRAILSDDRVFYPIDDFSPKKVVERILNAEKE